MDKYQLAIRRRIGKRVKQARELRGLSQEELAELAHTGNKHISEVERAATNLGIDRAAAIAKALSMDVSELLEPLPDERRDPSVVMVAAEHLEAVRPLVRALDRQRRSSKRRKAKASK
jgi:transcriptional regulator with XRE-family HTH domain